MTNLYDNKYRLIKDIGQGGFGKVFLAKEEFSGQQVAIKQLYNTDKKRQGNIIHEMQMVSRFNHPNIVNYKHHFVEDDLLYIVMEYCALGDLRKLMSDRKLVSTFVWKWMKQLTDTLQHVHKKGIVHHDIKPANILFTDNRELKITDFGVANSAGGTKAYLSPEALIGDADQGHDTREDIYALGVTLLELLTGTNPFIGKTSDEIFELHERKEFGIEKLPAWQQEIILKAIAAIPELRFQTMFEFGEAIESHAVPLIFDKEAIKAGEIATKADMLMKKKKWISAFSLLDYAEKNLKPNVNVLLQKGRYYLLSHRVKLAKQYYDKALLWNPRLNIQKELGWINLELQNYPTAISLLSDHLHRNPSDFEAFNLLAHCYYLTNRYEACIDLLQMLLELDPKNKCFANNYYICCTLFNMRSIVFPDEILKTSQSDNFFLDYNLGVVLESQLSHNYDESPFMKSKLLFMDYRFNQYNTSNLFVKVNPSGSKPKELVFTQPIIKIGRKGYEINEIEVPGKIIISRRHCVLINYRNDIWLYDLGSIGTYVNDEKIATKMPLIGRNTLRIGTVTIEITNEPNKLL